MYIYIFTHTVTQNIMYVLPVCIFLCYGFMIASGIVSLMCPQKTLDDKSHKMVIGDNMDFEEQHEQEIVSSGSILFISNEL